MNGYERAWTEDDATLNDPNAEKMPQAYRRLTGVEFSEGDVVFEEDKGDHFVKHMPNDWLVVVGPDGHTIYHPV